MGAPISDGCISPISVRFMSLEPWETKDNRRMWGGDDKELYLFPVVSSNNGVGELFEP